MYKVSYDTARDFTGVTEIARSPLMIVIHPSLPVKTVADLIKLAKARPGELSFGAASGGTPHLAGELFKLTAKIDLLFVPYKGEGPAIADAMGGQISMVFSNLPVALPQARGGRLRGLAVTSAQRVPGATEFPTVAESGLPGFEAFTWFGCFAPAATPREIIARLNTDSVAALNVAEVKEKMAAQGLFVTANAPEPFNAFVKKEIARWTKIVKDAGVKPQ
jgi:tripartite-type tricarboxylate transporter receptor subunit TctC